MWLYHRSPYEAPTVMLLLQKISEEEISFPEDTRSSAPLLNLLKRLLERNPTLRYKHSDLRHDEFLTLGGEDPLDYCPGLPEEPSILSYELEGAITRLRGQLRTLSSIRCLNDEERPSSLVSDSSSCVGSPDRRSSTGYPDALRG
eukprot:5058995-Pleurochrysis_carterae.AAC.2